jgi:HD-GYP domain-containing protein (c-di-GMP phosphodiesterase class II)
LRDGPCPVPGDVAVPAQLEIWDFVDRFLQQLGQSNDVDQQVRATLDMVRTTVRADLVFLYTGSRGVASDWAGPARVDLTACAALCRALLAEAGRSAGQLLRAAPPVAGLGFVPGSAALVRLSRSRSAWIVAVRAQAAGPFSAGDLKLMTLARRLLLQQQQTQHTHDQLKDMLFSLVRCLTASLDARDPYTWGHSERVARIAVRLGGQLGLHEAARSELYLGGLLHDVGKIGVSDQVLRKPGPLSDLEFEQVKQHTLVGDAILGHVKQLAHLRPLVRNHHEQYDGNGYPDGLAGEDIPLGARLLAVADSFDAMMSDRPYRKALAAPTIESILSAGSGRQWAPDVVTAFFACKHDLYPICERGLGDSVVRAVEDALRAAEGAARTGLGPFTLLPSAYG